MATFYAKYPVGIASPTTVDTVQGSGTAGTPTGGVLTVQGNPAGTPIPITGSITATNPSVGATGAADPTSATFLGINNGSGTLIGVLGDSAGRTIVAGAGTAGTPAGGVLTVQGGAGGTALPISAASLPLPSGAATAAKQPALGTSGTPSADVISVQGSGTAGTPLNVQVGTVAGLALSPALAAQVTGTGLLRTSPENTSLFYDPFDSTIDTTNRWNAATTSGTGAAVTQGTGGVTWTGGALASSYAYLQSRPTFVGLVPGFAQVGYANKIEATPFVTGAYRFWGVGTVPATPTLAAPLTNAVGWEIDTNGKMSAVVWASGVRTQIADLSSTGTNKQPTDGNYHRYSMAMRTDTTFWYIDGLDVQVAKSSFQFPTIQALPLLTLVVNGLSAPSAAATIISTGIGVGDSGRNNTKLSDGTNEFYTAAVGSNGALSVQGVAGGTALPISGSVTATIGAGTALIGKVGIDQTTPGTTNAVAVTTVAPVTTTTAVFQAEGATAAASITTSFVTIFTPSAATKLLFLRNNTDQPVAFSFDAGTTTNFILDSGDQVAIDFLANALAAATTAIQIKYTGSAPTTGSVRVNGAH